VDPSLPLQLAYGVVFLLLILVTAGIGYLTVADWRDRRRRERLIPSKPSVRKQRR